MICWKKTFTNSLVEATASENVRGKSVIASKQKRTMICGKKSKYITNLGTRNYRVLHFAYNLLSVVPRGTPADEIMASLWRYIGKLSLTTSMRAALSGDESVGFFSDQLLETGLLMLKRVAKL